MANNGPVKQIYFLDNTIYDSYWLKYEETD